MAAMRSFMLGRGKGVLLEMKEASRTLRSVPSIDLLVPTVCFPP